MSLALFPVEKGSDPSNLKLLERPGSSRAKRQRGEKQRQKEAQNCGKRSISSCPGDEDTYLTKMSHCDGLKTHLNRAAFIAELAGMTKFVLGLRMHCSLLLSVGSRSG
jgi:hypothetical protein